MGTKSVYIEEKTDSRMVRAAEGRALSGGQLAAEILAKVFALDARGRSLRRILEIRED